MARTINRLSARAVGTLAKAGRHADGGGLYLAISGGESPAALGLPFSLARQAERDGPRRRENCLTRRARGLAANARAEVAAGHNPIEGRQAARRTSNSVRTFSDVATELFASKSEGWQNAKVRRQWRAPLDRYADREFSYLSEPFKQTMYLPVLRPIWSQKPETASRVRGKIEPSSMQLALRDLFRSMTRTQHGGSAI